MDINTTKTLRELASNMNTRGRYFESKQLYDILIESNPSDNGLKRVASWNLREMKDYEGANKLLESILDIYHEKRHIWQDMATIYEYKINDIYRSKDAIQVATSPSFSLPENVMTYYELAIKCMENAHKELPSSWGIIKKIEKYYAMIGNYEKAEEYKHLAKSLKDKEV